MESRAQKQGTRGGGGGTLPGAWRRLVAQRPDAVAVIDGATGRVWSRRELDAAAAAWLAELPEEVRRRLRRRRVVVVEPNGARWFWVFIGLLNAGAVPVLADAKEAAGRVAEIARSSHAAGVWSAGRFAGAAREEADSRLRHARLRRGDLCLAKLTSGSTGTPRAIDFTHAQMLADGRQLCAAMGIGAGDLNLGVIPLGHSYGLGNLVVPLLEQGTAVLCAGSPFPQALAADCARWKPTVFPAVPALLRALVESGVEAKNFASLRTVISAGAALEPAVAAGFAAKFGRERRVHNFYGSSETGGIAYDHEGGAAEAGAAGGRGVGRVIAGVRLRWARGGHFVVASAAVHGRGHYSPPDRGELNARGELVLLGRAGRVLKIAGRRVDPAEVENALRALPGVRDAFVAAHPARPDALAAVVAADAADAAAAAVAATPVAEWRAALAGRLAAWKIPERVRVVGAFPVTQRGKPDRAALLRLLAGE